MTIRYLRSSAVGAANGTTKTDAFTTLTLAFAGSVAGDTIYMASDHAEAPGSALTLTSPGTTASPVFIYVVDFAGTTPPVSADLVSPVTDGTGTYHVATTGAFDITIGGFCVVKGMRMRAGSGAVTASIRGSSSASNKWTFDDCELALGGTSGGNYVLAASATNASVWSLRNKSAIRFSAAAQQILMDTATMVWRDCSASQAVRGTAPTSLFSSSGGGMSTVICDGLDLSLLAGSSTIVAAGLAPAPSKLWFSDCKLNAALLARYATPSSTIGDEAWFVRCGSAGNYDFSYHNPMGSLTTETTIVRTGGASDGTTAFSHKIVTTTNAAWTRPFECPPIALWNDTITSTQTFTVCGIWGGGAVPNNDDVWMDLQYLGTAGNPLGAFTTTTKADGLAAGTATAADTSTWGGSTTKFKLAKLITSPAQKGDVLAHVRVGAASTTVYIDPMVVAS